jgi:hypothetical protein
MMDQNMMRMYNDQEKDIEERESRQYIQMLNFEKNQILQQIDRSSNQKKLSGHQLYLTLILSVTFPFPFPGASSARMMKVGTFCSCAVSTSDSDLSNSEIPSRRLHRQQRLNLQQLARQQRHLRLNIHFPRILDERCHPTFPRISLS